MTIVGTLLAAAAMLAAAAPFSGAQPVAPATPLQLLDVPYLPQSEDLCGGAAVAMVMRYWGAKSVYAETFAHLVDRRAGGIRGDDLIGAIGASGWEAHAFRGDGAVVAGHLDKRRPVVALIEDRPGRFHYVVLVGWRSGRVFLHDPARAPFRILDDAAFEAAWAASGFWTLVVLPPRNVAAAAPAAIDLPATPPVPAPAGPCARMVEEGVRLAGAGDRAASRDLLEAAASACPTAPAPWRELAGLHALDGAWAEAESHAREAIARDRNDRHAWRVLATSLYLQRRDSAALAAWNRIEEPLVDVVTITGLERTRYDVAAGMLGLARHALLTPEALRVAERRLADLPAALAARATYRPSENGRADVTAAIVERPMLPASAPAIASIGARLAAERELSVSLANAAGGGEVWSASWRWWERRPRVALTFAAPGPAGGVWRAEIFDDRQTYGNAAQPVVERRRGGSFAFSNWIAGGTRIEIQAGVDRWRERGGSVMLAGGIETYFASDTIETSARLGTWVGSVRTWTLRSGLEWRSSTAREGHVWMARGGADAAGESAPLALWSGAGTGQGRDALLRAHPLLVEGIVGDGVFGRRVIHGGAEWRRWVRPGRGPLRVAPAVFVDAARAFDRLPATGAAGHVDAGAGLRVALPGGGFRIDVARGLRDGDVALSVGWMK